MKREKEFIAKESQLSQKKNKERLLTLKKKNESSKVDALIDRLFREPETIGGDFIPYTYPKYTGNSSPSENQSSEAQLTDFDQHRLFSDFYNLPKDPPPQEINPKNQQNIQEILQIAGSREFGHQDYELLLSLDQQKDTRGLEAHEIKTMRFWQVRKKVKKDETARNQFKSEGEEQKKDSLALNKEVRLLINGSEEQYEEDIHCNICMHHVLNGQMARELPCGHIFHKKCIDRWFQTDCCCPLDKKNIREMLKKS